MAVSFGDGIFFAVVAALVITAAFQIGAAMERDRVATDCKRLGGTVIYGERYECKAPQKQ